MPEHDIYTEQWNNKCQLQTYANLFLDIREKWSQLGLVKEGQNLGKPIPHPMESSK